MKNKLLFLLALTLFRADAGITPVSESYFAFNSAAIRAAFSVLKPHPGILNVATPFSRGGCQLKEVVKPSNSACYMPVLNCSTGNYLPDAGLPFAIGTAMLSFAIRGRVRTTHKLLPHLFTLLGKLYLTSQDHEMAFCDYSIRYKVSPHWCKNKKSGKRMFLKEYSPRGSCKQAALTGIT